MGGEERDDHGQGGVLEAALAGEVQGAGLGEHLPLVRGCQGDCLKPDSREYCCQGKVQLCKIEGNISFIKHPKLFSENYSRLPCSMSDFVSPFVNRSVRSYSSKLTSQLRDNVGR